MTDNDDGRISKSYLVAIGLIILGFMVMNGGFGMVGGGLAQMNAANEWDDRNEGQAVTCDDGLSQECRDKLNQENPYEGGGGNVLFGLILIPLGAAALYRGVND